MLPSLNKVDYDYDYDYDYYHYYYFIIIIIVIVVVIIIIIIITITIIMIYKIQRQPSRKHFIDYTLYIFLTYSFLLRCCPVL